MFTFKKMVHVLILLVILLLVSCSNQTPLIIEEVDSITVQCMGTEELLEMTDEKMLKKIIKEINNNRRFLNSELVLLQLFNEFEGYEKEMNH